MTRRSWTNAERDQLRALYPDHSAEECASAMGKSLKSVQNQVKLLGLLKSLEWIAERARERSLDPNHGGRANQFKPGLVPWNKGTHFSAGGRSKHSRFKPGQRPYTWKPVGHEVIRDGQLWRKVTDDHRGQQSRFNFTPVTVLVWEAEHGPVPSGHLVRFRDGMTTIHADEITVDKLELITRAENMRRNSVHNYPPEIVSVCRFIGKARQAIRKLEQSHVTNDKLEQSHVTND